MTARTRTMAGLSAGWLCSTECTRWPTVGGRLRKSSRADGAAPSSVAIATGSAAPAGRGARGGGLAGDAGHRLGGHQRGAGVEEGQAAGHAGLAAAAGELGDRLHAED